MICVRL